jgi:hypothetical protein
MPRFFKSFRAQLALLICVVIACVTLVSWPATLGWRVGDPDDQMRLLQVRDLLAGQSWFDVTQYRMNPPDGGPMHWSRLVDIPLALVIGGLSLFIGAAQAEWLGSILVPLGTFALALWLLGDLAHRLWGRMPALIAAGLPILSLPILTQFTPLRIDHHGWQIVLFLYVTRQLLLGAPDRIETGAKMGAALALWLLISIEGLPFAALFAGLLAWRWVRQAETAPALRGLALGMGSVALAGFSATSGWRELVSYCDAMSPVHLGALAGATLITFVTTPIADRHKGKARSIAALGVLATAGASAAAVMATTAPQCLSGAFVELDPLVRHAWYARTPEGLPLWKQPGLLAGALPLLIAGIAGLFVARKGEPVMLFGGALLVSLMVSRALAYPLMLACMFGGLALASLVPENRWMPSRLIRMGVATVAFMLLLPGIPQAVQAGFAKPKAAMRTDRDETRRMVACQRTATTQKLNALPPAQLMAILDASPAILQHTHHNVIATGHHRNQKAMKDVILAFTGPVPDSKAIFAKRGVQYLAVCPDAPELSFYAKDAPNGLWAQLKAGKTPAWLTREADIGLYRIWRFTPERN